MSALDRADREAVAAFYATLARGDDALVPAAVLDPRLACEPPLRVWR